MNRLSRPKHLAFLLALALACTMVLAFAMLQNPSEQRHSKNDEKPTKDQLIAQAADLNTRIDVVRANSSLSEMETLLGEMIDVLETQLAQAGPNDEASGNRYSLFTTYVELSLVMKARGRSADSNIALDNALKYCDVTSVKSKADAIAYVQSLPLYKQ